MPLGIRAVGAGGLYAPYCVPMALVHSMSYTIYLVSFEPFVYSALGGSVGSPEGRPWIQESEFSFLSVIAFYVRH